MRKHMIGVVTGIAVFTLTASTAAGPSQAPSDEAQIREVVELYFKGIDENDAEALRRAFHPEAQLEASLGRYWERPFNEWARFTEQPVAEDAGQRVNRIVSIDQEGLAAVAKTELIWPTVRYVDYLSLLKVDGEWRIVNKIWHQERR